MLYNTLRRLEDDGRKKALLHLSRNRQLPLDLGGAEALDKTIKEKYGILYMKTPGGFTE